MKVSRRLNRRSFLGSVTGSVVAGGALLSVTGPARAVQVTDCDSGPGADAGGRGSGRRPRTGATDRDTGAAADPAGCGRGAAPPRPVQDQGGYGHRPPVQPHTGITDRDPTDRAGYGHGGDGSVAYTGITDQDRGANADRAGSGRGGPGSTGGYGAHNVQGRDCAWLEARERELQYLSRVGVSAREQSIALAEELRAVQRSLELCR